MNDKKKANESSKVSLPLNLPSNACTCAHGLPWVNVDPYAMHATADGLSMPGLVTYN